MLTRPKIVALAITATLGVSALSIAGWAATSHRPAARSVSDAGPIARSSAADAAGSTGQAGVESTGRTGLSRRRALLSP